LIARARELLALPLLPIEAIKAASCNANERKHQSILARAAVAP
jgi:hypothetical protein